jgi:hypothetical protein
LFDFLNFLNNLVGLPSFGKDRIGRFERIGCLIGVPFLLVVIAIVVLADSI